MNALFQSEFSGWLCLALGHSLWQAGVVAVVASVIAYALRRRSANVRYNVYLAGLLVSLAAFPVTLTMLRTLPTAIVATMEVAPEVSQAPAAAAISPLSAPISEQPEALTTLAPRPSLLAPPPQPRFAPWIAAAYLIGVLAMAIRLALGMWSAGALSRRAAVAGGDLALRLEHIARLWKLRVVPQLAISAEVMVPKVVGILRPVILLPLSATTGLAPDQLDMVLAHELAHVRRHDLWVNLLQRVAETLLFFNPAIWYLSRRLSGLREFACDELVCTGTAAPTARYAAALVRVAELSRPRAAAEIGAIAATGKSPSELRRRVARLVGEPLREPVRLTPGGVVMLVALVLIVATPIAWTNQAQDASAVDTTVTDGPAVAKKLANGTEIELVAIGTHREKPQEWWRADGTRLQDVPLRIVGAKMPPQRGSIAREVIFRVSNLPAGASYIRKVVKPSGDYSGNGAVVGGEEAPAEFQSIVFVVPKEQKNFDLTLGIAAGKWQKVVDSNSKDGQAHSTPESQIVFSKAFRDPKGTVVVVSHNLDNCDTRTIAIDKQGNEHHAAHVSYSRTEAVNQTTSTFLKLELEQIERFELQKREYEWVEFNDLPANADATKPAMEFAESEEEVRVDRQLKFVRVLEKNINLLAVQMAKIQMQIKVLNEKSEHPALTKQQSDHLTGESRRLAIQANQEGYRSEIDSLKLALEQLGDVRKDLEQQLKKAREGGALSPPKPPGKQADHDPLDQQIDAALKADPKAAMLRQEIMTREYWIMQLRTNSEKQDSPQIKAYEKEKAAMEQQLAEYREKMKQQFQKQYPFSVHGRVTDSDGKPVEGVTVRAATGIGTLRRGGAASTDAEGRYRLPFRAGITLLEDYAPLNVGLQAAIITAHKPGWYETNLNRQGGLQMSDQTPKELMNEDGGGLESIDSVIFPNQPREVNFTLAPAVVIEGEFVGDGTGEIENQSLTLNGDELPPASSAFASVTTNKDGKFEMDGVPPGKPWWFEMRIHGTRGEVRSEPFTVAEPGVYQCIVSLDMEPQDDGSVILKLRQGRAEKP